MTLTTSFPNEFRFEHNASDDTWPYTLVTIDEDGGECRMFLSRDAYEALVKVVNNPTEVDDDDSNSSSDES